MSIKAKWVFKRSDGRELEFGNEQFGILEMKGIDTLKPELFSKKRAVGDGNIITGSRISARELTVTAEIVDVGLNASMRAVMNSFFTHRFTYDVYVTYLNEPRYAKKCRLLQYTCPTKNIYQPIKPTVTMLYPDAYFLSVDAFGKDIASTRGGRGFPYVNLVGKTFPFGVFAFSRTVQIYNDGDVEAYCRAVITFKGDVTNPRLIMRDSYVKVIDSFTEADTLILDAYDKSLTKNGTNIDVKLEKGSKWNDLVFDVGDNEISYDADAGNNLMVVNVYYNKRYLGV